MPKGFPMLLLCTFPLHICHMALVKTQRLVQDTVLWELYIEMECICTGVSLHFLFTARNCSFQTTWYHLVCRCLKTTNWRIFTRAGRNYKMFNTSLFWGLVFVHFLIQIFRIKLTWDYILVLSRTKS